MPAVSGALLDVLRTEGQRSDVYLTIHQPETIWTTRINDTTIALGETTILFDTGSGTDFALIEAIQEVWVGSSVGGSEIGQLRIKDIDSGDSGVTGTLTVSGHGLSLADDQYLTFLFTYPLKPRRSFLTEDEDLLMDDDITYSGQNENPPPVVVAGAYRAEFLRGSSVVFAVDASDSYAISDGSTTIDTYGLSVLTTSTAPTVSFNTGTGIGTITFTATGYYWAKYTVTDSNQQSQVSYRLYVVHSPDKDDAWYPFVDFSRLVLRGDWDSGGWSLNFTADDNHTLDDIPDHAIVIAWQETQYDFGVNVGTVIALLPDNALTIFVGYMADHNEVQRLADGNTEVTFSARSVESRLRKLFGFSVSIEAKESGINEWWEYKKWQYMGSIIHHTWRWRSTIFEVADVVDLNMDTELRFYFAGDHGNLYEMVDNFVFSEGIRARLVTDQGGRIHLVYDQQLLNDTDRAALTNIFDIQKLVPFADYGSVLVVPRQPENKAPFITTTGSFWDGSFNSEDVADIENSSYCLVAPGKKGDWDGPDPQDYPRQMFRSETHGKEVAGRFFAKVNNDFREVRYQFTSGGYLAILDFAYGETYTTSLDTSDRIRGIPWASKPLYLRDVMATYSPAGGLWEVNASFEPEADGFDGISDNCPEFPDIEGDQPPVFVPPPPVPEPPTDGINNMAGINLDGYVYKTPDFQTPGGSGGPTWARTNLSLTGTVTGYVVDAFSPFYLGTGTAVNGWVVTTTNIYYVEDLLGTITVTNQHTFATTPTNATGWRTIGASFGNFFENKAWLVVVSYYGDTAGHTGMWAMRSTDAGATWSSEVQITAHYDTTDTLEVYPPLYVSPRTGGLVRTAAFTATAAEASATSDGYQSTDYGATWAAITSPDILTGLNIQGGMRVPFIDNANELYVYHGRTTFGSATEMRTYRVASDGTTKTEISPLDGSSNPYGPRFDQFSIAVFDSDRRYVAIAGLANTSPNETLGLWVSSDYGNSWVEVIAPDDGTGLPVDLLSNGDFDAGFANWTFVSGPPFILVATGTPAYTPWFVWVDQHTWSPSVWSIMYQDFVLTANSTIDVQIDAYNHLAGRSPIWIKITDSPVTTTYFDKKIFDFPTQVPGTFDAWNTFSDTTVSLTAGTYRCEIRATRPRYFGRPMFDNIVFTQNTPGPGGGLPTGVAFGPDTQDTMYIWGRSGYIRESQDFGATVDNKNGNIDADFPTVERFIGIAASD